MSQIIDLGCVPDVDAFASCMLSGAANSEQTCSFDNRYVLQISDLGCVPDV